MLHRTHENAATRASTDMGRDDVSLRFIKRAGRDRRELYTGGVISPPGRRFALSRHFLALPNLITRLIERLGFPLY